MKGKIYKSDKRVLSCRLEDGRFVEATAKGNLLKGENSLVVGDNVVLSETSGEFFIEKMLERSNEVFRVLPRERTKKVTASNIDLLLIVVSATKPKYKRGIVDRFLVRASQWSIAAAVVFTKCDELKERPQIDLDFESKRLEGLGVSSYEVSSVDKLYKPRFLEASFQDLKETLKGKTAIVIGQSGVGKSTLINALSEGAIESLPTRSLGKANKGSHTTTWSELIDLGEFSIVDSPGIRSISISDLYYGELIHYFPDLEKISLHCQFSNCQHQDNSSGCAFQKLEGASSQYILSRLESFRQLYDELSGEEEWEKSLKKR